MGLPSLDNPLLKLDNVLATPHSTGSPQESICNMSPDAAQQWLDIIPEQRQSLFVKPEVWPGWCHTVNVHRGQCIVGLEHTGVPPAGVRKTGAWNVLDINPTHS